MSVAYRCMEQEHDIHWREEKRIFHFVQGTRTHGIRYVAKYELDLVAFADSNWASDNTDRKPILGYLFMLTDGPINWSRKNKSDIALSSTKSE